MSVFCRRHEVGRTVPHGLYSPMVGISSFLSGEQLLIVFDALRTKRLIKNPADLLLASAVRLCSCLAPPDA